MTIRRTLTRFAVAFLTLAAAACGEGSIGIEAIGEAEISLARSGSSASAVQGFAVQTSDGEAASIPADTVTALRVTVTGIAFLRAGADDTSDDSPAWTELALNAPVEIDLMALPTEGSSPLVVASGSVAAGTYGQVRLMISTAQIMFDGSLQIGVGGTFEGGVWYNVTFPSSAQSGIKTDVSFTIAADATTDVGLLFAEGSTFANATATGSGEVIVAPVIIAR
jgi:hypothetical protein